jgi:hypothetical protein
MYDKKEENNFASLPHLPLEGGWIATVAIKEIF